MQPQPAHAGHDQWLSDPGTRPAEMEIGDTVELKAKGDDGVVRGRHVDLDSDEMQQLLEGQMSFVLHDDLAIKSIRLMAP